MTRLRLAAPPGSAPTACARTHCARLCLLERGSRDESALRHRHIPAAGVFDYLMREGGASHYRVLASLPDEHAAG